MRMVSEPEQRIFNVEGFKKKAYYYGLHVHYVEGNDENLKIKGVAINTDHPKNKFDDLLQNAACFKNCKVVGYTIENKYCYDEVPADYDVI